MAHTLAVAEEELECERRDPGLGQCSRQRDYREVRQLHSWRGYLPGIVCSGVEWARYVVEWSGQDVARLNELSQDHNLPLGTVVFGATVPPVPPGSVAGGWK